MDTRHIPRQDILVGSFLTIRIHLCLGHYIQVALVYLVSKVLWIALLVVVLVLELVLERHKYTMEHPFQWYHLSRMLGTKHIPFQSCVMNSKSNCDRYKIAISATAKICEKLRKVAISCFIIKIQHIFECIHFRNFFQPIAIAISPRK